MIKILPDEFKNTSSTFSFVPLREEYLQDDLESDSFSNAKRIASSSVLFELPLNSNFPTVHFELCIKYLCV